MTFQHDPYNYNTKQVTTTKCSHIHFENPKIENCSPARTVLICRIENPERKVYFVFRKTKGKDFCLTQWQRENLVALRGEALWYGVTCPGADVESYLVGWAFQSKRGFCSDSFGSKKIWEIYFFKKEKKILARCNPN